MPPPLTGGFSPSLSTVGGGGGGVVVVEVLVLVLVPVAVASGGGGFLGGVGDGSFPSPMGASPPFPPGWGV